MTHLRIGTRGSRLALAQANWVKACLAAREPNLAAEIRVIKTSGDRFVEMPIQNIGGKGVFTKEIEEALLQNEIDVAVHSMKDLPTQLPAGLAIVAVPKREDSRDALVTRSKIALGALPQGAILGTGSLRRRAQLLNFRSDLSVQPIRGNIDTRLRKLDEGQVDGLVMAAAGLKRIGCGERIGDLLTDDICVSAVAQGALAIESRDDADIRRQLAFLHDDIAYAEISAERAFLDRLGGGCHVPIGARARVSNGNLAMIGVVASPDGRRLCRGAIDGAAVAAIELGRQLAERLLNQGAERLLASA
ncbi:MAG: hydroxymethylbilane synthase [Chloroflexota bacterium]